MQHHTDVLNGCGFCADVGRAMATYRGMTIETLDAVPAWRTRAPFSERERAALAYVEEATRTRRVADDTFAALRRHFHDRQIVALTWLSAVANDFNLLNGPLGIGSDGPCAIAERRTRRAGATAAGAPGPAA